MANRADVHVIKDLSQIKALADPLRQQILAMFVNQPRTTKQVSELLGVSATKLYRHVDHLERVGLIELVEKRPKRGTVEKYFRAIANRFTVAAESLGDDTGSAIEQSFARASAAVLANIRKAATADAADSNTILALGSLRLAAEDLPILQERILEVLKDLPSNPADRKPFGYLLAIYPNES